MNKNLLLTNGRLIKFSVIDLQGKEIEITRRFCSRPYQTKEYKRLSSNIVHSITLLYVKYTTFKNPEHVKLKA